jgi:hypothetical protein
MDDNSLPAEPFVPPAVDEAELLGVDGTQTPVIEAEPVEELDLPLDTAEQQELLLDGDASPVGDADASNVSLPVRPGLRRDHSAPPPAPLHLPPPAPPAPPTDADQANGSLSLAQLQNLVRDIPKVDPTPYAFTYEDASSFEDELEEWFSYGVEEQAMLLKAQASFAQEWGTFNGLNNATYEDGGLDWMKASRQQQSEFVQYLLSVIRQPDPVSRLKKLEALVYIMLGCWYESAGMLSSDTEADEDGQPRPSPRDGHPAGTYDKSRRQVQLIHGNVQLVVQVDGLPVLADALRASCLRACGVDIDPTAPRDGQEAERREVWCASTAVYVLLEVARVAEKKDSDLSIRTAILDLHDPGLLMILVDVISRLRWDDTITLPLAKVSLLLWKTILVAFGGLDQVKLAKQSFQENQMETSDAKGQPLITASPLDYHLFRQEILSKYPAYNPPPPLFPLEPENNSILPPLKNHPNKVAGNDVYGSGLGNMHGNNTSILNQPVHIATPAPSPPPSPAGPGGKGGKKQNYQTNQMFPFLYPPLDESSNKLGGKGSTDLQDLLVGRKWEGADIPSSILEAADLFAVRMRATRAMKQLWEERVQFMKYERGWSGANDDADVDELSLEGKANVREKSPHPTGSVEERMELVEDFYVSFAFNHLLNALTVMQRKALPSLQSVIIVLIKAILSHVTALVTQANGVNGLQGGFQYQDNQNGTGRPDLNGINGHSGPGTTNEELDAMRMQEILDKAVSGILILVLKWFKVSRESHHQGRKHKLTKSCRCIEV